MLAAEHCLQQPGSSACLLAIGGQDDEGTVLEHVEFLAAGRDSWVRCRSFGSSNASDPGATHESGFG
jgi:hypothetical protein